MAFELIDLPYDDTALEPAVSAKTLSFHHGKHHKAYLDKTNKAIEGTDLEGKDLEAVIASARDNDQGLFNNSAQIWNHSFFWQCLTPNSAAPGGKLADMIKEEFGSADDLVKKLVEESSGHFASGWGWLVLDGGRLKVTSLHDADTPVAYEGMKPLLTIDVWEHAYYIDYRNARPDYLDNVTKIINWDFVAQNIDGEGVSRADQG